MDVVKCIDDIADLCAVLGEPRATVVLGWTGDRSKRSAATTGGKEGPRRAFERGAEGATIGEALESLRAQLLDTARVVVRSEEQDRADRIDEINRTVGVRIARIRNLLMRIGEG